MLIELQNVISQPLAEQHLHHPQPSQIWLQTRELQQGRRYALQAQSGRGKSTFMHLLYGLRQDYKGEVLFNKINIRTYNVETWASIRQQKMAIVFQDLRLFPQLTAIENILAKAYLCEHKPDMKNINQMAEYLQVAHLLQNRKKTQLFSYGERQRIAIIRALVAPFEWLLLDEPFSHLDAENVQLASQLIAETCQTQGAGFILTSLGYDYPLAFDETLLL